MYFNFTPVNFTRVFSSIKETNWLISKGMCVFLFDVFNRCSLRLKYTIILKWSFLNDHIKVIVYFTKNDDLILFHFNMKKLNMFNFLHNKMMNISFEIIRHYCFILATTRNLQREMCMFLRKYSFE